MATLDADDLAAIAALIAAAEPIDANVVQINGSSASLLSVPVDANVTQVNGSAATLLSEPIDANVVSGGSAVIVPSASTVISRAGTNYLLAYNAETTTVSITVLNGTSAVDLSAKTLGVYFEDQNKNVIANVTSGITVSGSGNNVVSFALPAAVTASARRIVFAIRDQSAPRAVYAGGVIDVQHLPAGPI